MDQCIGEDVNNIHFDCFDFYIANLLQSENSINIKTSSLLLSVMNKSSEDMALHIIKKFAYKEDSIGFKAILKFLSQVEYNISQEELNPQLELKIFTVFSILSNCIINWKLRDIVLKSIFYNGKSFIDFISEILYKCSNSIITKNSQIIIAIILQLFLIIESEEKTYINSVDKLTSISDKHHMSFLIYELLKQLLQHHSNEEDKVDKRKFLEKLSLRIKNLSKISPRLTQELITQLSNDMSKYLTTVLFFIYQFDEPYSILMPSFIRQQMSMDSSNRIISSFPKFQSKKKEEIELYKKLIEIEISEHKKDVEALNMGLIQAESEVKILKYESITSLAIVESLQNVKFNIIY